MNSTMASVYSKLKHIAPTEKLKSLKEITSFKIGGMVDVVVRPSTIEQIFKVLVLLRSTHVPYMVLGNMTNILIADYHGVVIVLANNFSKVQMHGNTLIAYAGCSINKLCAIAQQNSLSGMESLFGIPGTIGGAVVMNAGAFGTQISDVVTSVLAIVDGKIKHFSLSECNFAYRSSAFGNAIVLMVQINLHKGNANVIQRKMYECIQSRKASQPLDLPSAGCTFVNIDGYAIGKLLDQDGYKGCSVGDAKVSDKHANFIVNTGNASVNDVIKLIDILHKHLLDKYGIDAKTEIKIIKGDNT